MSRFSRMPPAYYGVRASDLPQGWDETAWNVAWLGHPYAASSSAGSWMAGRSHKHYLQACVEVCDLRLLRDGGKIRTVMVNMTKEIMAGYLMHLNMDAHPHIQEALGPRWAIGVAVRGLGHYLSDEAMRMMIVPEVAVPHTHTADAAMSKVMGKPVRREAKKGDRR